MRIATLLLGAGLLAGCAGAEPTPRPASVREVLELPIRNAQELRWHFGRELAFLGYPEEWAPPTDAPLMAGWIPAGSPGGWSAPLIDDDPMQAAYHGYVGIVRRRASHPELSRPQLGLTVEVAQRSTLDAHFLLIKLLGEFDHIEPLNGDSPWGAMLGEPGLGDVAIVRTAAWDGKDADRAISHLHFVRRNVLISLAWVTARVDRAKDNDRRIIDAATAIDAQLRKAPTVGRMASSQRTPFIEVLEVQAEGPLTTGDSTHSYRVKADAKPRTGGIFHLFVEAAGPGRKLWEGDWGDVFATDEPAHFDFVPGQSPGKRELWAFAVNERGCIGEKKLDVEVVAPGDGG